MRKTNVVQSPLDLLNNSEGWTEDLLNHLPSEFRYDYETDSIETLWKLRTPFYEYLHLLTEEQPPPFINNKLGYNFSGLTDAVIYALEELALKNAFSNYSKFKDSPFVLNGPERRFLDQVQKFIAKNFPANTPIFIAPLIDLTNGGSRINCRMGIGPIIPDFIIFGLVPAKSGACFAGIIIEINGRSHHGKKAKKDSFKERMAFEMGLITCPVWLSWEGKDLGWLKTFLKTLVPADFAATRIVRRRVALRNIATWLRPQDLDPYTRSLVHVDLKLWEGFKSMRARSDCPPRIKKDFVPPKVFKFECDFHNRTSAPKPAFQPRTMVRKKK